MILFIDTADQKNVYIALIHQGRVIKSKKTSASFHQSEYLIHYIDRLLKAQRLSTKEIKKIVAVIGPGSFTSLRIGVTVANTLAWALRIPIAGISSSAVGDRKMIASTVTHTANHAASTKILEPVYGREPNITLKS